MAEIGLSKSAWHGTGKLRAAWEKMLAIAITHLIVCSFCGVVRYGFPEQRGFTAVAPLPQPHPTVPPYALAHAAMAQYTMNADGQWWQCSHCAQHGARSEYLAYHSPSYARALYSLASPMQAMMLSFLDTRLITEQWAEGYMHGQVVRGSMLNSPLLDWSRDQQRRLFSLPAQLLGLYAQNMDSNPLFQRFRPLLEWVRPVRQYPVLDSSILSDRTLSTAWRGEIIGMQDLQELTQSACQTLGLLLDTSMDRAGPSAARQQVYEVCGLSGSSCVVQPAA